MGIMQCCCDPYKLTYISAIIVAVEAAVFVVFNVLLMLVHNCVIQPPTDLTRDIIRVIWAKYFYDEVECKVTQDPFSPPTWINSTVSNFTMGLEKQMTVQENYRYQMAYLGLHCFLLVSSFVLIYGNARKRWGFYVPFLVTLSVICIMDVIIATDYFSDAVSLSGSKSEVVAAVVMGSGYFRMYIIWIVNVFELGGVLRTFCQAYMKRNKPKTKTDDIQKEKNMKDAMTSGKQNTVDDIYGITPAAALSSFNPAQGIRRQQLPEEDNSHIYDDPSDQLPTHTYAHIQQGRSNYPRDNNYNDNYGYQTNSYFPASEGYPNRQGYHNNQAHHNNNRVSSVYEEDDEFVDLPAPPKPKPAPKEERPFSYLNPTFQPLDAHDIQGMKRNNTSPHNLNDVTDGSKKKTPTVRQDNDLGNLSDESTKSDLVESNKSVAESSPQLHPTTRNIAGAVSEASPQDLHGKTPQEDPRPITKVPATSSADIMNEENYSSSPEILF